MTSLRRVVAFVGTRPEAIKMAPVVHALRKSRRLEPVLVSTGQHREMLAQVLDLHGLVPDHALDVMAPDQSLGALTARLTASIDRVLGDVEPDCCLVQGDTTTALIGALASFYRGIQVGHVEAGLRSHDLSAPFPEEANRKLITTLAHWHFAPTETNRKNLLEERVPEERIVLTGNTVIDALLMERERQVREGDEAVIRERLAEHLGAKWWTRPYVLVTGHRRENFGGGFEEICAALADIADEHPDYRVIYPVHLNPNVQGPVHTTLGGRERVVLVPPQGYPEFVALMRDCRFVLTDSGGIQEEAPVLGKPVLVMRETTERTEGVEAGTVRLVGARRTAIVEWVGRLIRDASAYEAMARAVNPYGDGRASERIVEELERALA
ncbi:MAG: UDP-N-acetylglucosamine 2-epimerase (non-hydrolyzing) [bacterium]|nr:UDP-N-acetylglucosamine 2-epimerase (non-hydrolyzing) [bacterium]